MKDLRDLNPYPQPSCYGQRTLACTLKPELFSWTLDPEPPTPTPHSSYTSTLNLEPTPCTPNPKPSTLNLKSEIRWREWGRGRRLRGR
jgi:hypothetical protein